MTYIVMGVIFLNNMDMAKMMQILSKMDKKELEAGIAKANQILKTKSKEEIFREINKNQNK